MRTNSYVMTVDKNSDQVLQQLNQLQEIKDSVSLLNKHSDTKHYVKCQGRWGRNNPNYNYRRITFCPLEHAVKWDVYIYRR
jgi:hypothetical protein